MKRPAVRRSICRSVTPPQLGEKSPWTWAIIVAVFAIDRDRENFARQGYARCTREPAEPSAARPASMSAVETPQGRYYELPGLTPNVIRRPKAGFTAVNTHPAARRAVLGIPWEWELTYEFCAISHRVAYRRVGGTASLASEMRLQ